MSSDSQSKRNGSMSRVRETEYGDEQHRFRSMVQHMDAKVGQILDKLDELGIDDMLPTFCEAAGFALPDDLSVDGKSLLPHLLGGPPNYTHG